MPHELSHLHRELLLLDGTHCNAEFRPVQGVRERVRVYVNVGLCV